jgi:hypothetical protein
MPSSSQPITYRGCRLTINAPEPASAPEKTAYSRVSYAGSRPQESTTATSSIATVSASSSAGSNRSLGRGTKESSDDRIRLRKGASTAFD